MAEDRSRRSSSDGEVRRSAGTYRTSGTGSAGRTGGYRRTTAGSRETRRAVTAGREGARRPAAASGTERRRMAESSVSAHRTKGTGGARRSVSGASRRTAAGRSAARRRRQQQNLNTILLLGGFAVLLITAVILVIMVLRQGRDEEVQEPAPAVPILTEAQETEPETFPQAQEEVETAPSFSPHSTDATLPSNLISFTNIRINDTDLDSVSSYQPAGQIEFGMPGDYTDVEGIITFRGSNFRDRPAYGYANMREHAFGDSWTKSSSSLGQWSGSGWTGQPLMMKWPAEVKAHMNMYDWAKTKDDLVEVIYATMDGNIYFLDLETGQETRDPMVLGFTFKGAGALDPRGYPIMYLGAGINSPMYGTAKAFIINLLDCSVMYTFGCGDPFSLRGALSFFDSSALVDAETDTLIYPGENGILYLIKLNTNYNEQAGTLSIAPDTVVKWRYNGTRSNATTYWWGMEDSACVYGGYMFIADNGGNLMCLDLNTLELVWVQDVLDDTNDTPVLSVEDGHLYLYVSTSFHLGWRSSSVAEIPIWKIDAETGEIIWSTPYNCTTMDGVSGGVQSTIALGKHDLSDYIYATVSMTDSVSTGVLSCINKKTGEVVWEHKAYYAWSSPVCVYNTDGSGVVIYCTSQGEVFMLDGLTGKVLSQMQMNGNVEASPAVYNDRLVVGTRNCMIYGVQLK